MERSNKKAVFKNWVMAAVLPAVIGILFSCMSETPEKTGLKPETYAVVEEMAVKEDSPFYIDFSAYPENKASLPIGVFDSGTGGLTVLDAILKLDQFNNNNHSPGPDGIPDFRSEKFVYFADSANMPYGRYAAEGKSDFLRELIIKDVGFLLGKRYYLHPDDESAQGRKEPVKAVVIACNTATAYGLDLVRKCMNRWGLDIPVIGVIEAGAREAAECMESYGRKSVTGVFATEGTVASGGYPRALAEQYRGHGMESKVVQQAGFGLAGAVDGDPAYIKPDAENVRGDGYEGPGIDHLKYPVRLELWEEYHFEPDGLLLQHDSEGNITAVELNSVTNYIRYYVTHMAEKTRRMYPGHIIRVIMLGCTHYPFYQDEFQEHFSYLRQLNPVFSELIGQKLHFIDPAEAEAEEIYQYLVQTGGFGNSSNDQSEFFISVPNPLLPQNRFDDQGSFPVEYKYGRAINRSLQYVKRIPLSPLELSAETRERIRLKMPVIFGYIKE